MCDAFDGKGGWFCGETQQKQRYNRRNSTHQTRWMMRGSGRSKQTKGRGGKKRRHKIKRTSAEKDCLFDEGWLQSREGKQAHSLKRGKTERKTAGEYVKGGIKRQGGIKRTNTERVSASKNIWEPSGSGEKNAGLSWNTLLPLLHCMPARLLHVQLTPSPKRHKVEEGERSLSGSRESSELCELSLPSDYKARCKSRSCIVNKWDSSEVNALQNVSCNNQTRNVRCLRISWTRRKKLFSM